MLDRYRQEGRHVDPIDTNNWEKIEQKVEILRQRDAKLYQLEVAEVDALNRYTDLTFEPVNKALRNSDPIALEQYDDYIRTAISGLNKLPPYSGPVKRGLKLSPADIVKHKPGEVMTYEAFTSASLNKPFTDFKNVQLHIESKQGRILGGVSDHLEESRSALSTRHKI